MSKSIKRNNKYYGVDDFYNTEYEDHHERLKEKRLRAVLKSKHKMDLLSIVEED